MKTVPAELRSHLDGAVTALCTCWEIERRDGLVLRFTDADHDVTVDGQPYKAIGAYSRTAIESMTTLAVDTLEVTGIAADLSLPVEELRAGLFDNAVVRVFMTSWSDSVPGKVKLRKGYFGEVQVLPNGTFTVELRGVMQKLAHNFIDMFSATCRHDLGDAGCTIDISHPVVTGGAHVPLNIYDPDFEIVGATGLSTSPAWFDPTFSEDTLFTTAPTMNGTYAARGGATGYLVQDVDISGMGSDFLSRVDAEEVTLTMAGWRRDAGGTARIRYEFMDHLRRTLRRPWYVRLNRYSMALPSITVAGDFTFETHVRVDAFRSGENIIFDGDGGGYSATLQLTSSSLMFDMENNVPYWDVDRQHEEIHINASLPDSIVQGRWYHVAVIRSGRTVMVYLDGQEMGRQTATVDLPALNITYVNGKFSGTYGIMNADYAEIRLWDRALARAEMNSGREWDLPTDTDNLVLYYPFDDGSLADRSIAARGTLSMQTIFPFSASWSVENIDSPINTHFRGGVDYSNGTGFEDVGDAWVLRQIADMPLPPHTRIIRITFDAASGSPNPAGSLLDSLYGYFKDPSNMVSLPNFSAGPNQWSRAGMVTSQGTTRVFTAEIDEPRAETGWFDGGLVTFYTGKNRGASMEVKSWNADTRQIELFLSLPYPIETGDLFTVYPGCDKSRICCAAMFNNVPNFFGTPDVPGEDELYRYPDVKE